MVSLYMQTGELPAKLSSIKKLYIHDTKLCAKFISDGEQFKNVLIT